MKREKCCDTPFLNIPLSDAEIFAETEEVNSDERLAQACMPVQGPGGQMFSACEGLQRGTIFAALDKPYLCQCAITPILPGKSPDMSEGGCNCG